MSGMKVTLKRADFYARTALKAATEAKYEPTLRLSIYAPALTASTERADAVSGEFVSARTKLLNQHDLAIDLINAVYAIRAQLAHANATHGISAWLTENAKLAAEEGRIRALIKAMEDAWTSSAERSAVAVLAKAKATRDQPTERYMGRDNEVTMAAFTEQDVATMRKQLKRIIDERAGINDALTAANVSNHITLDAATISILRKADILPAE
jgi:hypothetical protein